MFVDAELFWIVIATSGTSSLTVLAFIPDNFEVLSIENSSFFYSLKALRLQTRAPGTGGDRHFQALQVFELR
jgi:hypothetical protein